MSERTPDKVGIKLTPAQERMRAAVASLQKYMATYHTQHGYLDYSDKCYIDDVLYGLGRSLGTEFEFAGGFEVFKGKLREHLEVSSSVGAQWAALAIAMLHELRLDYGPGELKDTDGVKAIQTLRAKAATLHAKTVQSATSALPAGYKLLKDSNFTERSWPEDLSHENGGYYCTCCVCQRQFQGHKRRVLCKVCDGEKIHPYVGERK